jgi:hypothetical protein
MTNQKNPPNDPMKPVNFSVGRDEAKIQLIHSLSNKGSVPLFTVWFDGQNGWSYVFDNVLRTDEQARKAVGRIVFDIIAELKLIQSISTKAD